LAFVAGVDDGGCYWCVEDKRVMSLALFHFIRPYWLLALIPWLVIFTLLLKHKLQRGSWINVCDEALLPYILQEKPVKTSRLPLIGISTASLLAIFALAGPTWERVPAPAFRNDSGLVIALDLSRSMEAGDIKPSRLIRARYKIEDILKQRKDGQTALLVYAGDAFTVTPLTNDNATIASQLEALTPDIMPSAGSNTALAVEKAVDLFKQAGLTKGLILLVTDGVNADEIATVINKLGTYQLSVLAVGTEQGAPISLPEGGFLKDDSGTIIVPKLVMAELKKLADAGHGLFQPISDNDSDIKALLDSVDKSVQNAVDNSQNKLLIAKWDEKGVWLLLLILPLAALSFRRGLLVVAFLMLLPLPKNSYALEWQDLWQTKDQQAQQAFNRGDYDKAAKLFEDPAWQAAALYKSKQPEVKTLKNPTTATGFYNQGNVLAKAGKLEEAIKAYSQALKLNPDKKLAEDAQYNKKLVEDKLKKNQDSQNSQNNQNNPDKNKSNQKQQQNQQQQQKQNQDAQNSQNAQDKQQKDSQQQQQNSQQSQNKPQENSASQQQQNQNSQNAQNKPQKNSANQQTAQKQSEKNDSKTQAQQQVEAAQDEKNQANAQWLNRIPDDPAGLLRRKFKYQYSQRQRQTDNNGQAW
jgi:Ca-activated chloride channel family protein